MFDDEQLNKEFIENEVERIRILFLKNNYNAEEKRWFLESKINSAKAINDVLLLEVCDILLDELK